ncbi:hypothetical protein HanXRQr2_Chr10g0456471 [Helianthus annuus]|uniref:Uncharacterized protein n=1 Tax=Helianthus annuus TaxID=4232 RepID=A0A9K3HZC9_HELAN|nr:hypothetical protein HanXRQr2_Chr10g0456471 [Helianthus annuus]
MNNSHPPFLIHNRQRMMEVEAVKHKTPVFHVPSCSEPRGNQYMDVVDPRTIYT